MGETGRCSKCGRLKDIEDGLVVEHTRKVTWPVSRRAITTVGQGRGQGEAYCTGSGKPPKSAG